MMDRAKLIAERDLYKTERNVLKQRLQALVTAVDHSCERNQYPQLDRAFDAAKKILADL